MPCENTMTGDSLLTQMSFLGNMAPSSPEWGFYYLEESMKRATSRKPDEEMVAGFMATGGFLEGTKFWRSERKTPQNKAVYWHYTCPICSNDEYVVAGVCSGVFEGFSGHLKKGIKGCRCAKNHIPTQEQREYKVNRHINENALPDKFIGWEGEYKNSYTKIVLECSQHGEYKIDQNSYMLSNSRCAKCAEYGFNPDKPAYFYVLRGIKFQKSFTGFGITCDVKTRMMHHTTECEKKGYTMEAPKVFGPMPGEMARLLEKEVAKAFGVYPTDVKGFVKEATLLANYKPILEYLETRMEEHFDNDIRASEP